MGPIFERLSGTGTSPMGAGLAALGKGENPISAAFGASGLGKLFQGGGSTQAAGGTSAGEQPVDGKTKFKSAIAQFFPEVGDNVVVGGSGDKGQGASGDPWEGLRDVSTAGVPPTVGQVLGAARSNPFDAAMPQAEPPLGPNPGNAAVRDAMLRQSERQGFLPGQPTDAPAPVASQQPPQSVLTSTAGAGGSTPDLSDMAPYRAAIASIEAPGYDTVGPTHPKYGRALGQYQVMESNLPSWSQKALGRVVSPDEFLRTPAIQDAIFDDQFRDSIRRYGTPQDAASVWFTGRPTSNASAATAKDSLGTSGASYVQKFNDALRSNKRMAPPGVGPVQRPGLDDEQIDLGGGPQLATTVQPQVPQDPLDAIFARSGTRGQPPVSQPVQGPATAQSAPTQQQSDTSEMDAIIDRIEKTRNSAELKRMSRKAQLAMWTRIGQMAREKTMGHTAGLDSMSETGNAPAAVDHAGRKLERK